MKITGSKPLGRRAVLRGAGGVALGLPWMEAMVGRKVQAATLAPRRIIPFFTGAGFPPSRWTCPIQGTEATAFPLSTILKPFEAIRKDCLFIEGSPMSCSYDPAQQATAHEGGSASALTGTWAGPGNMYGGADKKAGYAISETVEYYIGQKVGKGNKFPAFYFQVMPESPGLPRTIYYAGKDKPIVPNPDPWAIHGQLFKDFKPPGVAAPVAVMAPAKPRRRVVDAVLDEYRALKCALGGDDRKRLEQHLAQLEELERGLGMGGGSAGRPTESCSLPAAPAAKVDIGSVANAPAIVKHQMDLMTMALACDLTRVAPLQFHSPGTGKVTDMKYTFLNLNTDHHDISHRRTTNYEDDLAKINTWHAQQIVYLANRLASIKEGDGSLLDNTMILWFSEIGTGWTHSRKDTMFSIIGGKSYFKTGRYVKFSGSDKDAHNRLLLHTLRFMGIDDPTFGAAKYCEGGPLAGLTR